MCVAQPEHEHALHVAMSATAVKAWAHLATWPVALPNISTVACTVQPTSTTMLASHVAKADTHTVFVP
jgi:hypothetical protein